mmetsp:Transcript_75191/g.137670  ORF Transcript_75191/g.137670 Transcript_75191/m.137670 type:complete len:81 (-) Transcript_75191:59-301(-)
MHVNALVASQCAQQLSPGLPQLLCAPAVEQRRKSSRRRDFFDPPSMSSLLADGQTGPNLNASRAGCGKDLVQASIAATPL